MHNFSWSASGELIKIIAERRNFFYLENSSYSLYLWFILSFKAGDSVKWWGEFCYLLCFPLGLRMVSSNKSLAGGVVLYLELPCLGQWCRKEVRSPPWSSSLCWPSCSSADLRPRRSQFKPLIWSIKQHSSALRNKYTYCPSYHQHF